MDIALYYQMTGEGFPLILLHGNGEDSTYFQHQIPALSQGYRVIAIDTRGHGKTPRGEAEFSIRQFADDLFDFMQEHQIKKAHLLGFSDGGNIALTFALKHPERVEKLILNGANLFPHGMKPLVYFEVFLEYVRAWFRKERHQMKLMNLMLTQPQICPGELANLHCQALVIAGTRDMIRDSHTALIAGSLPNSRLVLLEGDHFIAAKEPECFNREVLAFLKNE